MPLRAQCLRGYLGPDRLVARRRCLRPRQRVIRPALAPDHHARRHQDDAEIKPQGGVAQVPLVKRILLARCEQRPPVDLRPAGDAGADQQTHAGIGGLIARQQRPRADQRHVAHQHVEQLRQLVKAAAASAVNTAKKQRARLGTGKIGFVLPKTRIDCISYFIQSKVEMELPGSAGEAAKSLTCPEVDTPDRKTPTREPPSTRTEVALTAAVRWPTQTGPRPRPTPASGGSQPKGSGLGRRWPSRPGYSLCNHERASLSVRLGYVYADPPISSGIKWSTSHGMGPCSVAFRMTRSLVFSLGNMSERQ